MTRDQAVSSVKTFVIVLLFALHGAERYERTRHEAAIDKTLRDAPVVSVDDGKGGRKLGSSTPWGGDLAGSSNVSQNVASISGSGGSGGSVPLGASAYLGLSGSGSYGTSGEMRVIDGATNQTVLGDINGGTSFSLLNIDGGQFTLGADTNFAHQVAQVFLVGSSGVGMYNTTAGNYGIYTNSVAITYVGGSNTAAPIALNWSTATAPIIQSGTSGTSLTIGTNNASGVLNLQALSGTTYAALGGSTGQGWMYTAATPAIAATGNTTLSAANAADPIIKLGLVSLTGNVTVTFPNAQGFWIVDASAITLNAHTLQFISGSTTSAAVTPSTTNQMFFVSTYGGNTISIK